MDIFATVGTQLPFPRLMQALDQWAAEHPEVRVIAQTGADVGLYRHMVTFVGMGPAQFNRHMAEARIVVSHAGMGTILSAAATGKPVIVVPRLATYGEHRNDHQIDTAAEMSKLSVVNVVDDMARLGAEIDRLLASDVKRVEALQAVASPELLATLREFIWAKEAPRRVFRTQRFSA
jgi:UDP-N-acetylglucosamine transferase subunit ALG13